MKKPKSKLTFAGQNKIEVKITDFAKLAIPKERKGGYNLEYLPFKGFI